MTFLLDAVDRDGLRDAEAFRRKSYAAADRAEDFDLAAQIAGGSDLEDFLVVNAPVDLYALDGERQDLRPRAPALPPR